MSLLSDLLGDLLFTALDGGSAPSSRRARFITYAFSCAALVLAATTTWVLFASDGSVTETTRSLLVTCSVVYGAALAMGAGIHLLRQESDRGPTWFCFGSSTLAAAVPVIWWLSR